MKKMIKAEHSLDYFDNTYNLGIKAFRDELDSIVSLTNDLTALIEDIESGDSTSWKQYGPNLLRGIAIGIADAANQIVKLQSLIEDNQ